MSDAEGKRIGRLNQFIDYGDGTVTDTRSGLMWKRCAEGQTWGHKTCNGTAKLFSFPDAHSIQSVFAEFSDWRLPTIDEFNDLLDRRLRPQLDDQAFPGQDGYYFWSSTFFQEHLSRFDGQVCCLKLKSGTPCFSHPQTGLECVRLVRGIHSGQPLASNTIEAHQISSRPSATEFREPTAPLALNIVVTGTGQGAVITSPEASHFSPGEVVFLTARAAVGSKFIGWSGDVDGTNFTSNLRMNSSKTVSAELVTIESFALECTRQGTGDGSVSLALQSGELVDTPEGKKYVQGSVVTLTAHVPPGSKFKAWHGDATGFNATCTVTLDSAKTISAEFVQLESFTLDVTTTGTGSGRITRSVNAQTYFLGSTVTLTAQAEEGSIFIGWYDHVFGMDDVYTVTMNSAMSIKAEFEKLTISDTGITAELGPVGRIEIKKGQSATIFNLTLRNKEEQQVRVKVPLTSYVSQSGQASEQSSWATGLVNGSKGVTLSAGTFCEMGLVHFIQPAKGDRLYVNVEQVQPSARICFIFQCTSAGSWSTFLLVHASLESQKATADAKETSPAMASALKRIESLESTLAGVLLRLDAMQSGFSRTASNDVSNQTAPAQTLSEVLAWVAEHDRITVAEFRARLLPLDLLPSAVINEVNERALDMAGELALEKVGHEIIISKVILNEFLVGY